MSRGRDTARIVCDELGMSKEAILEIGELHEVKSDRDGQPKTKEYGTLSALVREGKGETVEQLKERADSALEKLSVLPEGTYLVCAHNAFNSCIQARLMGLEGEKMIQHWEKLGIRDNGSYLEVTLLVNPSGPDLVQDEDTLDTWFSSALWTFSTLGWPDKTTDLEIYHPTDVLETGYEILFFWVARMILMTGYALGTVPFHTVYLHGTVRDGQGRKMSKSLGNTIGFSDSNEEIEQKVKMMYTDPTHIHVQDPGKVEGNVVFTYLDIFDPNKAEVAELKAQYQKGGLGDVVIKKRLTGILQEMITPIRERREDLARDPKRIMEILEAGTLKAREIAGETLREVKESMKINYF